MNFKSFLKKTALIYLMVFIGAVCGYLIRVILARNFTVAEYGLFYAVYSFVFMLIPLRELGLNSSLIFFMIKSANKKDYAKAKGIGIFTLVPQIIIGIIISIILIISIDFLTTHLFKNPEAEILIIILVIIFMFEIIKANLVSTFGAFKIYLPYSLFSPINSVLVLITLIILSRFSSSLVIIPLAYLTSDIILIIAGYIIYKIKIKEFNVAPKFDKKTNKAIIKYASATILATFGVMILVQTDTFLLTLLKGTESVGYYNIIIPSVNIILFLINPAFALINPIITNLHHLNKKKTLSEILSKIFNNILIVTLPLSFAFALFSRDIINVIFGEKYVLATIGLQLYVLFFVFMILKNINTSILGCIGEPEKSSKIIFVGAMFNIIFDLILIPFFDFTGALVATGAAMILISVLSFNEIAKKIKLKINILKQIKIIISSIIFISICFFMKKFIVISTSKIGIVMSAFIIFLIGFVFYTVFLFILRVITKESIIYSMKLIRKK